MATWKKLVVSGSNISQLNNDAGYISASQVPAAANSFSTASFNGTDLLADSNQGTLNFASGSTGLNIVAAAGSDTLTFDLVAVPNSSLENDGITIAGQDISLGGTITADTIAGQISAGTITNAQLVNDSITVGTTEIDLGASSTTLAGLTSVTSTGFTGSLSATSVLADGVTATTQTSGDNSTKVATTAYVDSQVGTATLTIDSGNDASQIAIDLNDENLSVTGNDGLTVNNAGNDVGIGLTDGGILPVKLDSTLAGAGLTSTAGVLSLTNDTISGISLGSNLADLTVDDSSLELSSGTTYNGGTAQTINVKALGITNAMLAGNIANAKLVNDSITIGNATVALGGSTTLTATGFNSGSFSGSFEGDGSGLTGIASTLNIDSDTGGPSTIDLLTQTLDIAGGTNINTVVGAQTITVNLNDNITVTDAIVNGDLTVLGTASFQHETNLEVADRFILLASGSSATGDGGIIIQQATQDVGEVFGFDGIAGTERWGIGQAQNAASSSFTPEAFMAAALTGNASSDTAIDALVDARYQAKGNLFIGDDQDIWIWS